MNSQAFAEDQPWRDEVARLTRELLRLKQENFDLAQQVGDLESRLAVADEILAKLQERWRNILDETPVRGGEPAPAGDPSPPLKP